MPDISKTIEIIFGATDKTGSGFSSIGQNLDDFAGGVRSVTSPLADITDGIVKADLALVGFGAVMTTWATREAGEFQGATNEIYTLLDATPEKFGQFKDSILEYSRDSTQSIEAINAAVYSAISAGVDYEDALNSLTEAEKLAVGGKAGLNDSIVLLNSTLNAYGETTDSAANYADIFLKTVELGQTTIPGLAASFSQVTSTAAAAGVPITEVTAAIADLTAKGAPTSQAVTGLKAAISSIIKPSKEAQDAAAALGIQFDAEALRTKGLEGVLIDVASATGGNVTEIGKLFGSVEGLNAVLALSQNEAETFSEKLRQIESSTGAATLAYEKMAENFGLVNQKLENNITASLIQVGTKLLDEWQNVAGQLGEVFEAIGDGVTAGQFDEPLGVIEAFGDKAEDIIADIAKNLPAALELIDWSGFTDALYELGGTIAELFDGVDVSTPEGLAAAIQKIVDAGASLVRTTSGIVDGLKPFIEQVANLANKFIALDSETQKSTGELLGFGKGVDAVMGLVGGLAPALESIGSGLTAIAGASAARTLADIGTKSGALTSSLGKLGLAGAVGVAAYELTNWADLNDRLIPGVDSLGTAIYDLLNPTEEVTTVIGASARSMGDVENASSALTSELAELKDMVYGVSAEERNLIDTDEELAALKEELNKQLEAQGLSLEGLNKGMGSASGASRDLGDSQKYVTDETEAAIDVTKNAETGVYEFTQVSKGHAKQNKATKDTLEEAREASYDYAVELEKIASNERIKNIEAAVSLDIATLEADTQRVVAAFDSINTAIESSGNLLGTYAGLLGDASRWTQLIIEDLIEKEEKRRQEAHEKQMKLIEEEIRAMKARTDALLKGDALIKISADGLEPELEAFMWEIIKRIQLQANSEGSEFLLGI